MKGLRLFAAVAATVVLASAMSFGDTLNSNGMGRCDNTNFCNGAGDGDFSNYALQNGQLRDFFMFNLVGVNNITSATLYIWNVPQANDPAVNFYAATGLTYAGLGSGVVIANGDIPAVGDPGASTGYISFTLNAAGIAALNSARVNIDGDGNAFFTFGGDLPDADTQAFFTSFNSHQLPYLDFTTGDVTETPEPASLALLGSGLLGAAGTLRKRLVK